MANNITPKLKAYVQTDATGRVVSGTPVFRSSKPKDGNWKEIPMYYRGTGGGSTTTTTTHGGSVTPTAWVAYTSFNANWSCQHINGVFTVLYSSVSTLTPGVQLYTDAALTQPYNYFNGTFVAINNQVWLVPTVNGAIQSPQSC